MACYMVWLHTEQRAVVEVDVEDLPGDHDAREKALTEAALAQLDQSGGAEWETTEGWTEWERISPTT